MNITTPVSPDQGRDFVIVNLADLAAEGFATVCGVCLADYVPAGPAFDIAGEPAPDLA
jgi:hypothetical protein